MGTLKTWLPNGPGLIEPCCWLSEGPFLGYLAGLFKDMIFQSLRPLKNKDQTVVYMPGAPVSILKEPSQRGEHINPQGGAGFFLEDLPTTAAPLFSLGGRRAVPRVPSKFTSATGSWCNALLGASAHTTGCDSGLRDVSQFPGRCVRASPPR